MSNRYKGGVISATPPTTTGGEDGTASGAWTLEQQMQLQAAGLWPSPPPPLYIENVFSTYLYTGNASTQAITNGIDLSTKGGLVWIKPRASALSHTLTDTVRGRLSLLVSNTTAAQSIADNGYNIQSFNSNGFTLAPSWQNGTNSAGESNVAWTFRKQPKFFDIVTYTGDGNAGRTVAHNLGSVPGCIIVKRYGSTGSWYVYHRSTGNGSNTFLNATDASAADGSVWNSTSPTSTEFTLGTAGQVNGSGGLFVAYLFAHDAGGFGLTETDNVVSCGTYTTDGSGVATVSLGYEPQWVLTKATSGTFGTTDWVIADNMRGMPAPPTTDGVGGLFPNTAGAEDNNFNRSVHPTSTGFVANQYASTPYIYIAIRRGPMKVPTSGTSVFAPVLQNGGNVSITTNFPVDLLISKPPASAGQAPYFMDKLRGGTTNTYKILMSSNTDAEITGSGTGLGFQSNTAIQSQNSFYSSSTPVIWLNFKRAPSVFDIVCYTGNGATQNVSHNLGVAPELIIAKSRSLSGSDWWVYASPLTTPQNKYLQLQSTGGESTVSGLWGSSLPTSTTFGLGAFAPNSSGETFVAYLFATCAGVSKVGSYTGTATTLQIDCGFTAGSRFVLIKRTDSTGDWYLWDSARGIVAGNDPYLLLNSTAAEVTNTDYVDTYNAGFEISSTAPAGINASGGTYIFLAIA